MRTAQSRLERRREFLKDFKVKEHPAYKATVGMKYDDQGFPVVAGFTGTKTKPDFYYRFKDDRQANNYITNWLLQIKEQQEQKQQKGNIKDYFQVGDVLYNKWGYEQTSIDFYEITKMTKSSLFIRPITSELEISEFNDMAGYVKPKRGEYTGEEVRKVVQWRNGKPFIKAEFGVFRKYEDKQELYCSWYA